MDSQVGMSLAKKRYDLMLVDGGGESQQGLSVLILLCPAVYWTRLEQELYDLLSDKVGQAFLYGQMLYKQSGEG
jgi:hypothetical protein